MASQGLPKRFGPWILAHERMFRPTHSRRSWLRFASTVLPRLCSASTQARERQSRTATCTSSGLVLNPRPCHDRAAEGSGYVSALSARAHAETSTSSIILCAGEKHAQDPLKKCFRNIQAVYCTAKGFSEHLGDEDCWFTFIKLLTSTVNQLEEGMSHLMLLLQRLMFLPTTSQASHYVRNCPHSREMRNHCKIGGERKEQADENHACVA